MAEQSTMSFDQQVEAKKTVTLVGSDDVNYVLPISLAAHSKRLGCMLDPCNNFSESITNTVKMPFKGHLIERTFQILEQDLKGQAEVENIRDDEALDLLDVSIWLGL